MKPCSRHRKPIVWLVMDTLPLAEAECLRSHLRVCEGCRAYHEALSELKDKLREATALSSISTSEFFHQRLLARLQAGQSTSVSEPFAAYVQRMLLKPRVLVPAGCAAAVAIMFFLAGPRYLNRPPGLDHRQAAVPLQTENVLQPTIIRYQSAAERSLDDFDELLMRQANSVLLTGSEQRASKVLGEIEASSPNTTQ